MATPAGAGVTGIAQSAGDGTQPQAHPVGARPPLIPISEQQPHLITPSISIRSAIPGTPVNAGGPPLIRPPLGPPPPGPSPLFPPQAVMSRPPQAGGPSVPPFPRPPPGLPTTVSFAVPILPHALQPPGAEMPSPSLPRLLRPSGPPPILPPSLPTGGPQFPPSSQPPQNSGPPPILPPSLPTGGPQFPPSSQPPQNSGPPPILPPSLPTGGPQFPPSSQPPHNSGPPPILPPSLPTGGPQFPPSSQPPQNSGPPPILPPSLPTGGPQFPPSSQPPQNSGPPPILPPSLPTGGPQFPPSSQPPHNSGPPPILPPSLPTGSPQFPPSSQPPQNSQPVLPLPSQPPPNFPPTLPPSSPLIPPQLPTSGPQIPPISSPPFPPGTPQISAGGSQPSTSDPQISHHNQTTASLIRPPVPPTSSSQLPPCTVPPQFPPSILPTPTTPPQPLTGWQNIPPPRGLQHLPPGVPPVSMATSVVPHSPTQTPAAERNTSSSFQMPPQFSVASQPPTTGPPTPTSGVPSNSPHHLPISGQIPRAAPNHTPIPQVPVSNQQVPALSSSPQHSTPPSSTSQDAPPLLPSAQQTKGDSAKGEMMAGSEDKKGGRGGGREVWYEHRMSDGRVYYSHSQTRKTTWDRPLNVQIMPHPAQRNPSPVTSPAAMGHAASQLHPFPGLPLPGMPNAPHLVPTQVWSEFKTPEGKLYFYNKITRVSVWEKPKDFDLVMPLPPELGAPNLAPYSQQLPSSTPVGVPTTARPRMSFPHPAQSPASRPPLISAPLMFSPGQPPFNPGFPPSHPGQPVINPGLPPHMAHFPPPVHMLSTPGRPEDSNGDVPTGEQEVMELDSDTEPSGGMVVPSESSQLTSTAAQAEATTTATGGDGDKKEEEIMPPSYTPASAPELALVPVFEEPKGPRPTASVPVPGTPWSVVWTSDGRQFFFDVTSHVSLWLMPEELKDNPQLHKILENSPDGNRMLKSNDPPAKRMKLEEEGGGDSRKEDEEEEEMEEGGGLEIPAGAQVTVKPLQTEAMETEKKAAMMRSGKTVEERQEEFKEMLLERGVSAFSTWDKELPKFVFDPRYMLLNSKERKSCFDEFIRSRAEEERKEKRSKLKAKRDEFRKLLEDSKLHPKYSFSEFAQRFGRDERFKAVEKMREREQLFSDYLQELKRAGKHRENADGSSHSSSSRSKSDKVKSDFLEMLSEDHSLSETTQWRKVKGGFERDPRYRAVAGGSSQREEWFKEYIRSLATSNKVDPGREKEERIQASLKEREREVKMSRSAHEKEWGRERDQLRKTEAVEQFNAMLSDTVRTTSVVWNDARRQLRQDPRWDSAELLELSEKERLFQEHTDGLTERKRLQFRRLLEETSQISLVMPWKKARKLIREDPRYKNFTESDHRREAEYDKYLRDKMVIAKNEFRNLLKETKIISYKSHKLVRESGKHYKEIVKVLENDKRYLVLECVSDEREEILKGFMLELHLKGPPPPPTATNPSERLRKL